MQVINDIFYLFFLVSSLQNLVCRDFPGGPVVKTLRSQCRGPGFNLRPGN